MEYTFSRGSETAGDLTISFSVGGDATLTDDYTVSGADTFSATSGTVTILDGSSTAVVAIERLRGTGPQPF